MQTARQWMVTHEWMVKGNRQTEWIENRGILLWLAFYAGGLGGGLYLVSLFFNNLWGMFIGWFIVAVLKGAFHFIYLGTTGQILATGNASADLLAIPRPAVCGRFCRIRFYSDNALLFLA